MAKTAAKSPARARLMQDATISVDDAAEVLKLSRHGAYVAVRSGQIPSIRIGKCIRVPTASLRAMLGITETVGA